MNPPVSLDELKGAEPEAAKILRLKELMYNIGRTDIFCEDVSEQVPPWTVYHSIFEPDRLQHPSDIVFNPIIMAPPNDYNTVYTTLKRTKEQINALGQHICPIFFDMGLLSKALEVVWARKQELDGVFPVEGGMHFLMSLFAGIGYLYGDMGLKNLLFESDVFAKGTAEHILSGKDFDRALRAMIMIDEVLHRRFFKQFEMWVSKCSVVVPSDWPKKIEEFKASLGK